MLERKTIGKYFNDFRLKKDFINLTKQKSMKKNTDKFECINTLHTAGFISLVKILVISTQRVKITNFRVPQSHSPAKKERQSKKGKNANNIYNSKLLIPVLCISLVLRTVPGHSRCSINTCWMNEWMVTIVNMIKNSNSMDKKVKTQYNPQENTHHQ